MCVRLSLKTGCNWTDDDGQCCFLGQGLRHPEVASVEIKVVSVYMPVYVV